MDNTNQTTQPPQENHETLKVSTSSDPHHSPKMLLIGLAAGLIIIIGGGIGYFLGINNQPMPDQTPTPTPLPTKASAKVGVDETANPDSIGATWKIYQGNGFSFKYPENWYFKDMTKLIGGSNIINSIYFNDNQNIDLNNYKIKATVDTENIQTLQRFLNYADAGLKNTAEIINTTIADENIITAIVTSSELNHQTGEYRETGKYYKVLIPVQSNTLQITSMSNQKQIVDQILSTFKFSP